MTPQEKNKRCAEIMGWCFDKEFVDWKPIPDFYNSISDAGQLVEWARHKYQVALCADADSYWCTWFTLGSDEEPIFAEADTAPAAIVEAFIKAFGKDLP